MLIGDVVKWQHRTDGEVVGTVIHGDRWDKILGVRAVVDGEVRLFRVWRNQAEVVREAGKPPSKVWGVEPWT